MKKIMFVVNAGKSYFKTWGEPQLKPNVNPPLVVPLLPGGKVTLTIDEQKCIAEGEATDLLFSSDQFQASPNNRITGNLQTFGIKLAQLNLNFDPKTGKINDGGGWTDVEPAYQGGFGNVPTNFLGLSLFLDGNSPNFDFADGLGCRGGLVLEMGLYPSDNVMGSPGSYLVHIEAAVGMEDLDGDGQYEVVCPAAFGIPVTVGRSATELVSILFGVTTGGGGIGILPNGRIIHIPPGGPPDPILKQIVGGFSEVVRGLALRDLAKESSDATSRAAIGQLGLKMAEKGLKETLEAVRKELAGR